MRLVQFVAVDGERRVGLVSQDGLSIRVLRTATSVYELALQASRSTLGLESLVRELLSDDTVDYDRVASENHLLPPLDHPDPAHCYVTGTGLNHLGSAMARDAMHAKLDADPGALTDSMKMFKMGLEGGRPKKGQVGAQPEWFYKGDGDCIMPPGHPLELPPLLLTGARKLRSLASTSFRTPALCCAWASLSAMNSPTTYLNGKTTFT